MSDEQYWPAHWKPTLDPQPLDEPSGAHWPGCWKAHHACAITEIYRLREAAFPPSMLQDRHFGPPEEDQP